ncbi:RNA methyltransferase [Calidifontibacter sp. DB0510]|uniref:RNA methyltransferase n=1 Tax=Metallococcus carri TaxID=1656884 RepID=A0A967B9C5_9MICO|nr:RNA methyltransferase [Metallococcus carri]NHN57236.1 RNA methyltransferase [Metallococcus carri]NOP37961.1 RNA methyltransferase [Calidifontibacter sp. DB2511S]
MTDLLITSASNPRLKQLISLRRRRIRDAERLTLVEGYDELRLALDAGLRPHTLFHCPELTDGSAAAAELVEAVRSRGVETVRLSRPAFEKVAYREGADGFLAVAPAVEDRLDALQLPANPLVLLTEAVEKPGNLGAMLRTADAVGVDAVIAADPVTDWGNPNVVRGSKGTVFSVPVASASTTEALDRLRALGVRVVATTPDTDTLHTSYDWTGPVAIAVGTEKYGLTDELLARADARVRIPMVGRANSLNVATSAAVVLYEAMRQRTR